MNPTARIGLFGGSFDPVHLGHLLVAQAALEEARLDRLVFIPAAHSPFKQAGPLSSGADRLRLLRLALAGHARFEIDDQELCRGGVSYTIDTVRDYARRFPGAQLYCLIGADHVALLSQWRDAPELARLAAFVVVPRPQAPAQPPAAPFRGQVLNGFPLALSSSQVRERIRMGLPIEHLTGPAVAEAISKNRLYL